jgi:hypothetical protein
MVLAAAAVERAMKRQEVLMRALSGKVTWLQARGHPRDGAPQSAPLAGALRYIALACPNLD